MRSRRSESSTARTIQRRELPWRFGSSPIGLWNFVARTTSSRRPRERLADDLLGLAVRVDVGGVDEVDPGVQRRVDDPDRLVVVGVAPRAEHHRAEAELADRDAGAPERSQFHRRAPLVESRAAAPSGQQLRDDHHLRPTASRMRARSLARASADLLRDDDRGDAEAATPPASQRSPPSTKVRRPSPMTPGERLRATFLVEVVVGSAGLTGGVSEMSAGCQRVLVSFSRCSRPSSPR